MNKVRTASYDHAGFFFCQVQDQLSLHHPDLILHGYPHSISSKERIGKYIGSRCMLSILFDKFLWESCLLCDLLDQLFVIERRFPAGLLSFSYCSSTASNSRLIVIIRLLIASPPSFCTWILPHFDFLCKMNFHHIFHLVNAYDTIFGVLFREYISAFPEISNHQKGETAMSKPT